MIILYISYWSMNDGLTVSTVLPHIRILSDFKEVSKIFLITIERENVPDRRIQIPKTEHLPFISDRGPFLFLRRIMDFIRLPKYLTSLIRNEKIDLIIARSSPAGAIAYKVWEKTGIRFYVESFEPHADYMLDSAAWKKWDLRYMFQKKWESKIKSNAYGIYTVSNNYREKLLEEGIKVPVETAACAVDTQQFKFDPNQRTRIRNKHQIPDHVTTGIYVGKFGDIYYDAETFELFKTCLDFFRGDFFLIIITPERANLIRKKLVDAGFPTKQAIYFSADHERIPDFLSAADFGFAPIRKASSRLYCSPVKIGEYWANGLPVLLTRGVGDESTFIEMERGGIIFDIEDPLPALEKLKILLGDPTIRQKIPELAGKYRSFNPIRKIYENIVRAR